MTLRHSLRGEGAETEDVTEMEKAAKGGTFKIVWDPKRCYGCRTCELACSFHRQGVYGPESSSIRVTKSNQTGRIKWHRDFSCDSCGTEEMPLCVKYCFYDALKAGVQP